VHLPQHESAQVFDGGSYDHHGCYDIFPRHGHPADIFPAIFYFHGGTIAFSPFTFHLLIVDSNTLGSQSTIIICVSMLPTRTIIVRSSPFSPHTMKCIRFVRSLRRSLLRVTSPPLQHQPRTDHEVRGLTETSCGPGRWTRMAIGAFQFHQSLQ